MASVETAVQVMAPCTINGLARARKKHKEFVVVVSQSGCEPCSPAMEAVKKAVDRKVPILEIKAEDARCDPLLQKLKVTETPSVMYLKGKSTKWINNEKMGDELKALVAHIEPPKVRRANRGGIGSHIR